MRKPLYSIYINVRNSLLKDTNIDIRLEELNRSSIIKVKEGPTINN